MFLSSLYVYDTRPCYWSFLESHHDSWSTCLSCNHHVRGDIPPWTTLPFCILLIGHESELLIAIRSSRITHALSQAQGPIYELGPCPYIYY